MASKNHAHNHCEHENLQYCKHCKVVHCLDCKQEWPEKETMVVEKVVYKDWKWTYTQPTIRYGQVQPDLISAVSDKTVYDKDRFVESCRHS